MAGSDYHRGDQDTSDHKATYALFMNLTKWGSLLIAALLVLVVVWFCTPAGFTPGLISAVVVAVIGWLALKKKPGAAAH